MIRGAITRDLSELSSQTTLSLSVDRSILLISSDLPYLSPSIDRRHQLLVLIVLSTFTFPIMNCGICNSSIKRKEPSLTCSGICTQDFHQECVKSSLNYDPQEYGSLASFRCEQCTRRRSTIMNRSTESSQDLSHLEETSIQIETSSSPSRFTLDDVMRQL